MFHGSATGRRREQTLPEAPGPRQAELAISSAWMGLRHPAVLTGRALGGILADVGMTIEDPQRLL
jgi:hypothetical protein